MAAADHHASRKVPEVTVVFWIMKIAATTLGETAGDTVTMTSELGLSRWDSDLLFRAGNWSLRKLRRKAFTRHSIGPRLSHPPPQVRRWPTLPTGHWGSATLAASILFVCLMVVLGTWYWSLGSISVATVATPKVEAFYWAAITFSQTLGTALGDWIADDTGLGYEGGALLFAAALVGIIGLYFGTNISRVFLFWAAFILTRPLGATVGDFLDKPVSDGGLALSRPLASAVIGVFIVACLFILPQKVGEQPGRSEPAS